jgi:hypothetical protein
MSHIDGRIFLCVVLCRTVGLKCNICECRESKRVVQKVGCTAPWGAVGLPRGLLRGKGVGGDAGGGPLRARCSLIYD